MKDYRTQVLGIAAALSGIIAALATWSTGTDMSLANLVTQLQEHIEVITVGLGLWFGGDKLNTIAKKPTLAVTVSGKQ